MSTVSVPTTLLLECICPALICLGAVVILYHFVIRKQLTVGHGYDIHKMSDSPQSLQSPHPLTLGGIAISQALHVDAHSDGDALLHAIADAILGAAGLPDIGMWFPDSSPDTKDLSSSLLLKKVMRMVMKMNWRVLSIDGTIVLQRPKLSPFIVEMVENVLRLIQESEKEVKGRTLGLSWLLNVPLIARKLVIPAVNLKVRTNEGLDSVGKGKAVVCYAVVLLERNG